MSYTVYKHTSPSRKVYIGITSMSCKERWKNGAGYKSCVLLNRAIQKYGWENFKHEILFTGLTKEEAEAKEIELIAFYRSTDPDHGYNMERGGDSLGKHSEETLKKMSENRKGKCVGKENPFYGKQHSNEWVESHLRGKNNPMFGVKGSNHPRYGIKHTKEAIEKMKEAKKGKYFGASNPNAKRILCVETGEVFECAQDACKKMNVNASSISTVLHGKGKTTGGYHWQFIDVRFAK